MPPSPPENRNEVSPRAVNQSVNASNVSLAGAQKRAPNSRWRAPEGSVSVVCCPLALVLGAYQHAGNPDRPRWLHLSLFCFLRFHLTPTTSLEPCNLTERAEE